MSLSGKVCVVTGASKGIGRGIALGMAEAGAKVYATGRAYDPADTAPGTLGALEAEAKAAGGLVVPVACDHSREDEIERLFKRVDKENDGQIDILVNNCYSAVQAISSLSGKKFWEKPVGMWDEVNNVGLRAHYIASWHASKLMVARKNGLIMNVSSAGGLTYIPLIADVAYGAGKQALDRMGMDMAYELKAHNVAVVTLWPGPAKTEKVMSNLQQAVESGNARAAKGLEFFNMGETCEFSGKVAAHLASRPHRELMSKKGRVVMTAEYALRHGIKDGKRTIPVTRSVKSLLVRFDKLRWLAAIVPHCVMVPLWLITLGTQNKFVGY